MVAQKHNVRALHGVRNTLAFANVQRQAVVMRVCGHPAMKTHGVLRQARVQCACARQGKRRRIRHMRVQHAGFSGDTVNRRVDKHGRGLHGMAPGQYLALDINHHNVIGLHLAPHQAARVEQKAATAVGQLDAEVVAYAFGQAVVGGSAQR